jgi:hypothetical protein
VRIIARSVSCSPVPTADEHQGVRREMEGRLMALLRQQQDPRLVGPQPCRYELEEWYHHVCHHVKIVNVLPLRWMACNKVVHFL